MVKTKSTIKKVTKNGPKKLFRMSKSSFLSLKKDKKFLFFTEAIAEKRMPGLPAALSPTKVRLKKLKHYNQRIKDSSRHISNKKAAIGIATF